MTGSSYFVYQSSTSPFVGILIMAVVLALPIKVGAILADAKRSGIIWCGATGLIGLLAGYLAASVFGGTLGGPLAAFLGFVIAIRFMLGTTLLGALGLTVVAMGVSLAGLWMLATVHV
jgi:hypothetical protein